MLPIIARLIGLGVTMSSINKVIGLMDDDDEKAEALAEAFADELEERDDMDDAFGVDDEDGMSEDEDDDAVDDDGDVLDAEDDEDAFGDDDDR